MATAIELLESLENLGEQELKKFKWLLQQAHFLKEVPPIPKSRLEKADRPDTVDLMVQTYSHQCVEVALRVFKQMRRNDLVRSLSDSSSGPTDEHPGGVEEVSDWIEDISTSGKAGDQTSDYLVGGNPTDVLSVGSPVESSVGSPVESPVGSPVGSSVGSPVESSVGSPVESSVGSPVESSLGSPVELSVGSPVESSVGLPVESSVGSPVESSVGLPVESSVGLPVESSVGSPVESSVGLPMESSVGSPVESSLGSPVESSVGLPVESSVGLPVESSVGSPVESSVGPLVKSSVGSGAASEVGERHGGHEVTASSEDTPTPGRDQIVDFLVGVRPHPIIQPVDQSADATPATESPELNRGYKATLQSDLQNLYRWVQEDQQEHFRDLNLDLFIINGTTVVGQSDMDPSRPTEPGEPVSVRDVLHLLSRPNTRTVVTCGSAGSGKSFLVQEFLWDWAEGKTGPDFHLVFPLDARQMLLWQEDHFSLAELVLTCVPGLETSVMDVDVLHHVFTISENSSKFRLLFVLDGLDESWTSRVGRTRSSDVREVSRPEVLVKKLITGNLLPSARLWITMRPTAFNQILLEHVDVVTEIRGFSDQQKEDYFRRRFWDQPEVERFISHIQTTACLHAACQLPAFCWISAAALEEVLRSREDATLPETQTQMFAKFLMAQINRTTNQPYVYERSICSIRSLMKLALQQLLKYSTTFTKEDLARAGITMATATKYAAWFPLIFQQVRSSRRKRCYEHRRMFCFTHLSLHEFLAAVHASINNIFLSPRLSQRLLTCFTKPFTTNIHKAALKTALRSPSGHLDTFLRFLLGLSLQTSHNLILQGMLTLTGRRPQLNQSTRIYIRKKIRESKASTQRIIHLLHCLNELQDHRVAEDIQWSLSSGHLSAGELSLGQWSALVVVLLSSAADLDVFNLKKYWASEEVFLRLQPVLQASNEALLAGCTLSWRSCEVLAPLLSSKSSHLKLLDLSNNDLQDSGVKLLCSGLERLHCKLETLRLLGCQVTEEGCSSLVSALSSNPSHLRELDLSYNHPGDIGLRLLVAGLEDPGWRLDTLRLDQCGEQRLKPGLKKYAVDMELDPNTANKNLKVSHNRQKVRLAESWSYPDHPSRFDFWPQVLCKDTLSRWCYWEVLWKGQVDVVVCYQGIRRKGNGRDSEFGANPQSWILKCFLDRYEVFHNQVKVTSIRFSGSNRVAVYVDCSAGVLTFYVVSSDSLVHIHTFNTTFTQPLVAGFGFDWSLDSGLLALTDKSSASLCR